MLFPYRYVQHSMEKMHDFICFIFFDVWCIAPNGADYSIDLFNNKPELKDLIFRFHNSENDGAYFFNGHVERIYGLFSDLQPHQIDQLEDWFESNNNIEAVCANRPNSNIARYSDIQAHYPLLLDEISKFFKGLYSSTFLDQKDVRDVIGDINAHYRAFMETNSSGKCPFCGIADMKGIYHTKRDAYDHYLPKGIYPFNSINFHNLVPACHECNSSYKTSSDPAYPIKDPAGTAQRRKFFYPYKQQDNDIEISIRLDCANIDKLQPDDIHIDFGPANLNEEIDTWKDVYGIEERYKAKCCGKNDGRYWFTQIMDEWQEDGRTPESFMNTMVRQVSNSPYADTNFLKLPFLQACREKGLFE